MLCFFGCGAGGLSGVGSLVRVGQDAESDERKQGQEDPHQVVAREASGEFVQRHEGEDDVDYRDKEQDDPPQGAFQFFQQDVEVVDGDKSFPEGVSHLFKSLAHEKEGEQREDQRIGHGIFFGLVFFLKQRSLIIVAI